MAHRDRPWLEAASCVCYKADNQVYKKMLGRGG